MEGAPSVTTNLGILRPPAFDLKMRDEVEICCPLLSEDIVLESGTYSAAPSGGTGTTLTVVGALAAVCLVAGAI